MVIITIIHSNKQNHLDEKSNPNPNSIPKKEKKPT